MSLLGRMLELFLAGGPVMWPLLVVSLWLWTLVALKLVWLAMARRERLDPRAARECLLHDGEAPPARGPRGAALALLIQGRSHQPQADRRLWEAAVRRQGPRIWSHLSTVTLLAAVAPLLGLLGTVTGMISTFEVIRIFGTGNAQALSSGISEALITTQAGLLVAIPGLLAAYFLRRQARRIQQGLVSFHQALDAWLGTGEGEACCT